MAQVNLTIARGNRAKDVTSSTGTLTLATDNIALSFNQSGSTGINRMDVRGAMLLFEQYLSTHNFPPP